jgi:hypothetical protein
MYEIVPRGPAKRGKKSVTQVNIEQRERLARWAQLSADSFTATIADISVCEAGIETVKSNVSAIDRLGEHQSFHMNNQNPKPRTDTVTKLISRLQILKFRNDEATFVDPGQGTMQDMGSLTAYRK